MALLFTLPRVSTIDLTGAVAGSSELYFYQAGTSTPLPVYSDSALTTPITQPVTASDAGLFPTIYLNDALGIYKVVCRDADGAELWTVDRYLTGVLHPIIGAETTSGVTPTDYSANSSPYDVRRVGIVPNSTGAASANTTALRELLDPSVTGITGTVFFPNTTGADVYYFNDFIGVRDRIDIDLCGCTLQLDRVSESGDSSDGLLHGIRRYSIRNGKIVINYDISGSPATTRVGLCIGARSSTSTDFFPTIWDSDLAEEQGDILLENLEIETDNATYAILMLGGLRNVTLRNVRINGNESTTRGIYYEFGFATSETNNYDRQTSHAYNLRFENITVTDTTAQAVGLSGAYSATFDGLYVRNATYVLEVSPGESAFYRPWDPRDLIGSKSNVIARNVVGQDIATIGIGVSGIVTGGYLVSGGELTDAVDKCDLQDCTLENVVIEGASGSTWGISSTARRLTVRGGLIKGFDRGIFNQGEGMRLIVDDLWILDSLRQGILVSDTGNVHSPARRKFVDIRNCFIAGSGQDEGGTTNQAAISMANATGIIENCVFGYDSESTQLASVHTGSDTANVIVRGCHTVDNASGNAYVRSTSTNSDHCVLDNVSGITTADASWGIVPHSRRVSSVNLIEMGGQVRIADAATSPGGSVLAIGNATQTTVGSAGAASALPANPSGYLRIFIGSTEYVIPYYAQS